MKKKIRISKKVIRDYERFITEITELNGIIYHLESIIDIYSKEVTSWKLQKTVKLLLGSHFTYRSPYDGKLIYGGFYKVGKKNVKTKIEIIKRKVSNYYVALAYEFFEKFLRSITARIIVNNQKSAKEVNEILGFSSYDSCLLFLRNEYRGNNKLISLLRNLCPELKNSFKKEKGLRNFLNFYRVYTKCRNHIIHSNDLVDLNAFKEPESVDEKFAMRYFGIKENKRRRKFIIDTTTTYKETLETIAKFGYLLISSFDSTFIK